ncbi:MAG: hypothetical protein AAF518_09565 [Spirochaetota bacterium]
MIVLYEILFFLQLIPIALLGWFRSLFFSCINFIKFWSRKTILEQISILFLLSQVVLGTLPSISYEVQFLGKKELMNVSLKINLWIICYAGLLFTSHFFWKHPWHKGGFFIGQILLASLLGIGYWQPNPLFVDFLVREDFFFNHNFFLLAGVCAIVTLLSILRLLSSPAVSQEIIEDEQLEPASVERILEANQSPDRS